MFSKKVEYISVLLFESSSSNKDFIEGILGGCSHISFVVDWAPLLKRGLKELETWKGNIIFANLNLKDSKGVKTFLEIKAMSPNVPILVYSESDNDQEALEAVRSGAQDYLVTTTFNSNMLQRVFRYTIERHKSQQEVSETKERYRAIFENSAVAISMVDADERIVSCNRYLEKMLGYSVNELYLKNISELYPSEEWALIREKAMRQKAEECHFETKMLHRTGKTIDIQISLSFLTDDQNRVMGSIGIMQDITERKHLENVKAEFINTVSHEMRTPLTIIREGVSQVLDGILGETTEGQQSMLGISMESIDRLSRIINDMLDMSRLESGKFELNLEGHNMVEIAEGVKKTFEVMLKEKNLGMEVHCSNKTILAQVDKDKMVQIFTNLVGNAFKFTDKGKIEIELLDQVDSVLCRVKDTGRGIGQDQLSQVFDAFTQIGREDGPGQRGTGLGLAICKRIVELHCGEIWVESELNQGATFIFTIPKKHS